MTTEATDLTRRFAAVRAADDVPDHDGDTDISRTTFLASDDTLDRYGTRIAQDWMQDGRIDAYMANPVIALSHNYSTLSVGRGENLRIQPIDGGQALFMDVAWDMADEEAARVALKYARGMMHAGSVGFRSESETRLAELPEEHAWHADRGWRLSGNHLLEFSVGVLVPGNANAIAQRAAEDPDFWLRDAVLASAPPDWRALVLDIMENDPTVQKMIREVAGDVVTTREHAAEIVKRNARPLSFLTDNS